MTDAQKQSVQIMRRQGLGYKQIADVVGISVNTIKSFCRRGDLKFNDASKNTDIVNKDLCKQCNKRLMQKPKSKPKTFCDDKCRFNWWNANRSRLKPRTVRYVVCANCDVVFGVYGNGGQKYCGHPCYISHRFKFNEEDCLCKV